MFKVAARLHLTFDISMYVNVNNDERPDLNERYHFSTAMTRGSRNFRRRGVGGGPGPADRKKL